MSAARDRPVEKGRRVKMAGDRQKLALAAGAIALVLLIAWRLPVNDWVLAFADRIRGTGARGVALFVIIYVVATVAVLPGSLLTIAAGFIYGPLRGLLIVSPTSVVAATAAFLLGRTVFRKWAKKKLARSPKASAVDRAIGRESFKLIVLLRLSPLIPFNLLNYALGLSSVRLDRYVIASFIGMLPGTWLYVYLGSLATTTAELAEAGEEGGTAKLALMIAGLVATVIAVIVLTRAARRALDQELNRGS